MESNKRSKLVWIIITLFLLVPLVVSVVSTIHVINFFELSNSFVLALTLAMSFEIGALAALAGLVALDKINKNVVWFIFVLLTIMQIVGNTYFAYDFISIKMAAEPNLIKNWTELFGLTEEEPILVKRIIAILSGGILPIISLAFLDLLINYIKKVFGIEHLNTEEDIQLEPGLKKPIINETPVEEEVETETPVEEEVETETLEEENYEMIDKDFQKALIDKKKRLDNMKEPNLELLKILYKNGEVKSGDELPQYNEFINQVELSKFSQKEIKMFLTLCNYLEIFKVSNTHKIALKNYDEATKILGNYLTWSDEE